MSLPSWKKTLYITWLTQFIALAGGSMVFPFMPLFVKDLGITRESEVALYSGLGATASGFAMFVFSPIWGALADRFGRKKMLLRAYFCAVFTIGAQAFATNVWQFILLRGAQGAFTGTVAAAAALVAASTPAENVAYSMGMLQVAVFISGTAGPLIGGVLAETIGFRATFLVTAVAFLLGGLLLLFGVKEDFEPKEGERRGPWATFVQNTKEAASSREALIMIGLIFLVNASLAFSRPIIPLFVDDVDPAASGIRVSGYIFAALALTSAIAALVVGAYSSKIGYKRALVVTLLGAGIVYLPIATAGSIGMLIFFMALVGLFSGGSMPAANALLSINSPPDKQGSAFGLAGSANALAFSIAPLLGGTIAAAFGTHAVFLVLGVMTLAIAGISQLIVPNTAAPAAENEIETVGEAP